VFTFEPAKELIVGDGADIEVPETVAEPDV
jgi:hypothetical protein